MASGWYFNAGGKQDGPVSWDELREMVAQQKVAADNLVWNEGMPEWAEARSIPGLILVKGPPALPKKERSKTGTELAKPSEAGYASFEVILEPFTGAPSNGRGPEVRMYFDDFRYLIPIKLCDGFRGKHMHRVATGRHLVKLVPLTPVAGVKKLLLLFGKTHDEVPSGGCRYVVEFPTPGHYTVSLPYDEPRRNDDYPSGVAVTKEESVAEDVGPGGVARKAASAIGGWWKNMGEESRRSQLHGVWEAVDGQGAWFLFTGDGGMLRADGFGAKYRWADEDTVEVYESGVDATARFNVLSLGKHELLLKAGAQTGHYKRGVSITESVETRLREEARVRAAETRQQMLGTVGTVAAVLAVGGLAVLCGAAAATAEGGSPGVGSNFREVRCEFCNGKGWRGIGEKERCIGCGGHGVKRLRS